MGTIATRREKVILDLESNIAEKALRDAAAIRLLNEEVDKLSRRSSGSSTRTLGADLNRTAQDAEKARTSLARTSREVDNTTRSLDNAGKKADQAGKSFGVLAGVAAGLGPGLIPIGAVAIPAVSGLAAQLGFAALAAGTAMAAFNGVGGALSAMNKAHLVPTVKNLQAARLAMNDLSPAAQQFTRQLAAMRPAVNNLGDTAATAMFPGLSQALVSIQTTFPKIEAIMAAVGGELGNIGAQAGASLAGPQWASFFTFLRTEAPRALADMAAALGHVAHAVAQLWMAFTPLNRDFSQWLVNATNGIDKWASSLSKTQGFQDFIAYVEKMGPQVGATLGAIANALVQIVTAAAPIGGPTLKMLEALANVIAAIADSRIGTPLLALVAAFAAFKSLPSGVHAPVTAFMDNFGAKQKVNILGVRDSLKAVKTAQQELAAATQNRINAAQAGLVGGYSKTANQSLLAGGFAGASEAEAAAAKKVAEAEKSKAAAFRAGAGTLGKAAALTAGLTVATTGLGSQLGITNTASLGLMGTVGGPLGAALGAGVGLMMDLAHAGDAARASMDGLDRAVSSGNIAQMKQALSGVQSQKQKFDHPFAGGPLGVWKTIGTSVNMAAHGDFLNNGLNNAIDKGNSALMGAAAANVGTVFLRNAQLYKSGMELTAAGAKDATQSLADFTTAAQAANDQITKQAGFDAYKKSLLDFTAALKTNHKTLSTNTQAGLANRAALRQIASSALTAADSMLNLSRRTKFMQNARHDFINAAVAAGMTRAAARRLADEFGLLNLIHAKPKVTANTSQAVSAVGAVGSALANLHDKTVTVTARTIGYAGGMAPRVKADGGPVFAMFPGETRGPRDDTIPAYLSHGEYVVNAAAAARNFGLLEQINAQKFAGGGMARRHPHHRHHATAAPAYFAHPHGKLQHEFDALTLAVKASNNAITDETQSRDNLVQTRDSLNGQVKGSFMTDVFGGTSSVWAPGGGAGNVLGLLKGDIAKANAFKATLTNLHRRGVSGDALAAIAATGDVGKAQALASMSNAQLGQYGSLFKQREAAAGAVGLYAGNAAYGAAIARDNTELKTMNATLVRQEAELKKLRGELSHHPAKIGAAVAGGVNHAATAAQHKHRGHH